MTCWLVRLLLITDIRSIETQLTCVQHPLSQVYSFVPIPGAQQHKRPRRRYEEIERMYKCGWNGCEKAYGTLNHLNAHVTMQSHGQKRTPEGMFESIILSPHVMRGLVTPSSRCWGPEFEMARAVLLFPLVRA